MLLLPLQAFFSQRLSISRKGTSKYTDERIKLINQALTGVSLMKINGWEMIFVKMIEDIRHFEIKALLKTNFLRAMNESIFFATPVLVGFLTFITYAKTGGDLSVQKVLTVLTLFNVMQMSMTKFFPFAIQFMSEARVSAKRIQRVLLLEESESLRSVANDSVTDDGSNTDIKFDNFTTSWNIYKEATSTNQVNKTDNANESLKSAIVVTGDTKTLTSIAQEYSESKSNDPSNISGYIEDAEEESLLREVSDSLSDTRNITLSNINLTVSRG